MFRTSVNFGVRDRKVGYLKLVLPTDDPICTMFNPLPSPKSQTNPTPPNIPSQKES